MSLRLISSTEPKCCANGLGRYLYRDRRNRGSFRTVLREGATVNRTGAEAPELVHMNK